MTDLPYIGRCDYDDMTCEGCRGDVTHEYAYILFNDLWDLCQERRYGAFLCIGCVEDRIGRKLAPEDFDPSIPLNTEGMWDRTVRLNDRMGFDITQSIDCHPILD